MFVHDECVVEPSDPAPPAHCATRSNEPVQTQIVTSFSSNGFSSRCLLMSYVADTNRPTRSLIGWSISSLAHEECQISPSRATEISRSRSAVS